MKLLSPARDAAHGVSDQAFLAAKIGRCRKMIGESYCYLYLDAVGIANGIGNVWYHTSGFGVY